MKKTTGQGRRKLEFKRETLRQLDSLDGEQLARVAGGWYSMYCSGGGNTLSGGSNYC
jgi:hypothetical protein